MFLLATALAAPVTLFLTDPRTHAAPGDRCVDPHCLALLDGIEGAQRTIDFAVYGFRDQTAVVDALVRAVARGVRVRGVVDADADGVSYYADTAHVRSLLPDVRTDEATDRATVAKARGFRTREACPRPDGFQGPLQCLGYDLGDRCLIAAHASREPLVAKGDIQHDKLFVFDEQVVWTGSTNVSDSGTGGYNANLVVRVESATVARWYLDELDQMRAGRFHHDKEPGPPRHWTAPDGTRVTGLFSPQDRPLTRGVRPLIQSARESIDVAVFFLTHKHIAADLIAAHRRGVRVRVLLDATAAKNGYTKHELLRAAGIPVKVEPWGGKMHAKTAVIDERIAVVGSMNWTAAGEGGNDENTLLLGSPALAGQLGAWFEALWNDVPDRWLAGRPDPESWASGTACTDGVDNDFDHLVDAEDPGCSASPPPLPSLPPWSIVSRVEGEGTLVKGVEVDGKPVWLGPLDPHYPTTPASRYFCSRWEAEQNGYRKLTRSGRPAR